MTEIDTTQIPENLRVQALVAERDVPATVDYFAVGDTEWVTLPDGVQKVEVKVLNEGERKRYLNKTNREVTMNARTRDLKMQNAAGDDLHELIKMAVVGWYVIRRGEPLSFNPQSLREALEAWPPSVVDVVVRKIRDVNPWLKGTVDDLPTLREERDDLNRRIAELEAVEAKNLN